jgi:hypothetical protein
MQALTSDCGFALKGYAGFALLAFVNGMLLEWRLH